MWIDLKKLDCDDELDLPFREEMRMSGKRETFDFKWYDRTEIGDYDSYTIARRILTHYIGKPFSDAYSHFCKLVKWNFRQSFFDEFNSFNYWCNPDFYVDENGIIRKTKPRYRFSTRGKLSNYEKKLNAERNQKQKKMLREAEKERKSKQYSFKTKQEIEDDRTCKVKLISHGFDEHSFRNH